MKTLRPEGLSYKIGIKNVGGYEERCGELMSPD
jgi:hypothetical protein